MKQEITYILFIVLIMSLFSCSVAYAQKSTVKGRVVVDDQIITPIYMVKLEPVDTTQAPVAATFVEDTFEIPIELSKEVVVTISSLGYGDMVRQLHIAGNQVYDLGEITLLANPIELKGVVVSANKIQIEKKGNNLLIKNIGGTPLGDAGNFVDMLKRTPGLVVKGNDELAIVGYGSPAIYVNDREVRDKDELQSLRSSDVRSIEIIRTPSARYGASVSSVVHIRTKNQLKDQLGATIENYTNFHRKVSNFSSINLNIKKGVLSSNVSYRYGRTADKAYEYSRQVITGNDRLVENYSEGNFGGSGNSHNIFAGMSLGLNSTHTLGIQYSGSLRYMDRYSNHKQQIKIHNGLFNKLNHSDEDEKNNAHNLSLSYNLKRNENSSLLFIVDYVGRNKSAEKLLSEKYIDDNNRISLTSIDTKSKFDVYTFTGQYTFKFFKDAKNSIGVNSGYMNNDGRTEIENQHVSNVIPQVSKMENAFASFYYTFSKKWGKLSTDLGVRYEYDHNKVREIGEDELVIKQEYSDLFPNAMIEYSIADDISVSASYRKK